MMDRPLILINDETSLKLYVIQFDFIENEMIKAKSVQLGLYLLKSLSSHKRTIVNQ